MRMGILETDHVGNSLRAEHGNYPGMFANLLHRVPNLDLEFAVHDVMRSVPTELDCDAYLITGSHYSVYDDRAWIAPLAEFVGQALDADKKIVGICFGHQLLAHFFGGEVGRSTAGWAVGVHTSSVTLQEPWMEPDVDALHLIASHRDQVLALPRGAKIFTGSEFCPIGGYTIGDQVITIQNHPEFSKAYCAALITQRREMLGEAVYADGMSRLESETNEEVLAHWIMNFVTS